MPCPGCKNGKCDRTNGECLEGCIRGKAGKTCEDGNEVGATLCIGVGAADGDALGVAEGTLLGVVLGSKVGITLGVAVGIEDGLILGVELGAKEGATQ